MSTETKRGFTIVELLTVMSIIIIMMGILVPAMSRVRRYAKVVTQKGQFSDISKGLELYRNDHQDTYPDSGATSTDFATTTVSYPGAMRLCEALLGQDGMGFHPSSRFSADGLIPDPADPATSLDLYLFNLCVITEPTLYDQPGVPAEKLLIDNLQERVKYVDAENIKAVQLRNLFNAGWAFDTVQNYYTAVQGPLNGNLRNAVIGDVFMRASIQGGNLPEGCPPRVGQKAGMPVLYYKADPSKLNHDTLTPLAPGTPNTNIYNFDDNYAITALGCPWESTQTTNHPIADMTATPQGALLFYKQITNTKITSTPRPHNEDSYLLVSAGWDGLYGTKDDVFNFTE